MEPTGVFYHQKRALFRNATQFFDDVELPQQARANLLTELDVTFDAIRDAEDIREFETTGYDYCLYWQIEASKGYVRGRVFNSLDTPAKLTFLRTVTKVLSQYSKDIKIGNSIYTAEIIPFVESACLHFQDEIDLLVLESSPPQKTQKPRTQEDMITHYIRTCDALQQVEPSLKELADRSGIPRSTWNRYLYDRSFVDALIDRIEKMKGHRHSKIVERKLFWEDVKSPLMKRFEKILRGKTLPYNDQMGYTTD